MPKREKSMHRALVFTSLVLLTSCAASPSFQYQGQYQGGERVDQPGVSFVLPAGKKWASMERSASHSVFEALGMPKNDTVIVSQSGQSLLMLSNPQVMVSPGVYYIPGYNFPPPASKEDFLKAVSKWRASSVPSTGRFEVIRNSELLLESRPETCVIYKSEEKVLGVKAKRGSQYSVLDKIGMHCVHPNESGAVIQVEFSRKAPPDTTYPNFEATGLAVLQSVKFDEF